MSASPPLSGRLLLRLVAPARDYQFVAGDLEEEFATAALPVLGVAGARRWYLRQAAASAGPLVLMRLRRGAWLPALACAQLFFALPVLGLHVFWQIVLAQVPLRAEALTPSFQVASAACVLLLAAMAGAAQSVWTGDSRVPGALRAAGSVFALAWLLAPALAWGAGGAYLVMACAPLLAAVAAVTGARLLLPATGLALWPALEHGVKGGVEDKEEAR